MVDRVVKSQESRVRAKIVIRPVNRAYYANLMIGNDYQIGLGRIDSYNPMWLLDCVLGRAAGLTLNELRGALVANKSMRTEIKTGRPRKRSRI